MNRPFQSRHHSDYPTDHHHSQLRWTDYPDCCFMAILSWRRPLGPRIVRKLWSNTCERTQSEQKEQAEDSSYPEGIEVLLMEAARKSFPDPENPDNPMTAPRDCEVRQLVRVLVLQNEDHWIRPTDLSWRFPILVTIRELPFRNLSWKANCECGSQGWSQEEEDSEKKRSDETHRDTTWQSHFYQQWDALHRLSRQGHSWRRK